jgi:hypothetical protein
MWSALYETMVYLGITLEAVDIWPLVIFTANLLSLIDFFYDMLPK